MCDKISKRANLRRKKQTKKKKVTSATMQEKQSLGKKYVWNVTPSSQKTCTHTIFQHDHQVFNMITKLIKTFV